MNEKRVSQLISQFRAKSRRFQELRRLSRKQIEKPPGYPPLGIRHWASGSRGLGNANFEAYSFPSPRSGAYPSVDRNEEEIYQDHILDHYEDPYHRGVCDHPSHQHEGDNPLCGDVVSIQLRIDPTGVIREAWFTGDGCCISQASASMLVEASEGKTVEQVKQFSAQQMLELLGAKLTPNRQKCCLLPWRVIQAAVHSPIAEDGGQNFGGPNLGEES